MVQVKVPQKKETTKPPILSILLPIPSDITNKDNLILVYI